MMVICYLHAQLNLVVNPEYQITNNELPITNNDHGCWNWNYHLSIA